MRSELGRSRSLSHCSTLAIDWSTQTLDFSLNDIPISSTDTLEVHLKDHETIGTNKSSLFFLVFTSSILDPLQSDRSGHHSPVRSHSSWNHQTTFGTIEQSARCSTRGGRFSPRLHQPKDACSYLLSSDQALFDTRIHCAEEHPKGRHCRLEIRSKIVERPNGGISFRCYRSTRSPCHVESKRFSVERRIQSRSNLSTAKSISIDQSTRFPSETLPTIKDRCR